MRKYVKEQTELYDRLDIDYNIVDDKVVLDWKNGKEITKMSALESMLRAYERAGIDYVVRNELSECLGTMYQTLFMIPDDEDKRRMFEIGDIDRLSASSAFIEFEEGKLASY